MDRAEFNSDGVMYTKQGKFSYEYGDSVTVIEEVSDKLVRILVNEGEAAGKTFTVDKQVITRY